MTTHSHDLNETLRHLREQLEEAENLPAETRARLATLAQEVETALAAKAGGQELTASAPAEAEAETLVERLARATHDFEDSHPTLASAVGGVAGALSRMGI